jgi:hypothetical protein
MSHHLLRATLCVVTLIVAAARVASAQTCVAIDEPRDMLTADERSAAVLLVERQLALAGQRIVRTDCVDTYALSHIRLGTTIIVTLSGPMGSRDATALGLDDLPAVYSQLVRALMTGEPMGSLAIVDRTNVSAIQDQLPRRVRSEGYWYARLGYGRLIGESSRNAGVMGFGYRAEFNQLGLDISFLNLHMSESGGYFGSSSSAASLIKLEGLFFTDPTSSRSAYFGGGLSYGRADLRLSNGDEIPKNGYGSGLQGELTVGYEIARATSVRLFVQGDVTLPFYKVRFETYTYPEAPVPVQGRYLPPTITVERQYAPSVSVSVGFGWQRPHR